MKKTLLVSGMVFIVSMLMAQQNLSDPARGAALPASRDYVYLCMENPVFSQVFPSSYTGHWCQYGGYVQTVVADDYSASGPFSSFRIWGGDYYSCPLAPTEEFDIFIWDGSPFLGGNLVHSFTLQGTTTSTGIVNVSTSIYQIDFDFGIPINLLNGWIGITRKGATCSEGFAWAFDDYDTGNSVQKNYDGSWQVRNTNLFFCLGGTTGVVPISNWALFIGIGLILVFALVRFRKLV
jgi:hypothetical protein